MRIFLKAFRLIFGLCFASQSILAMDVGGWYLGDGKEQIDLFEKPRSKATPTTKHYEVIVTSELPHVPPEKQELNRAYFSIFAELLCEEIDCQTVSSGKVLLRRLLSEENDRLVAADGYALLSSQENELQDTRGYLYAVSAYESAREFIETARRRITELRSSGEQKDVKIWQEMVLQVESTIRALFCFNSLSAIGSELHDSYSHKLALERNLLTGQEYNAPSRFISFEYYDVYPNFAQTMQNLLNEKMPYYESARKARRILLLDEAEMKKLVRDYKAHLNSKAKKN
ncbi:MAG: hypothetical protein K2W94_02700 [Alphaproteobacteria bacterium]|nr:hypothetical protein [Alphaproteobacteria bacterium]